MLNRFLQHYKSSLSGISREVWLLAISSFINRCGAMVIPFLTIYLTTQLGFTAEETGFIMACFGAGSVLGSFTGGKMTDRLGYFPTMLLSFFLAGAMFIILKDIRGFYPMAATIFLLSFVADIYRPAMYTSVGLFSNKENQTRSISLIRLAVNLGYAAGPAIGGIIAANIGYSPLFIIDGLTCILCGFFVWATIPPTVTSTPEVATAPETMGNDVFKDTPYLIFLLINAIMGTVFMQLIFTAPVFFKSVLLYSEQAVGFFLAFNCVIVAITEMPLVHYFEHKKTLLHWVVFGAVLVGLSYVFLMTTTSTLLLPVLFMVFISIGEVFMFPFSNSYALSRSNDRNRGAYMGYYTMTFSVSLIVAPLLGFQIIENFGYNTLWMTLLAMTAVSVIGLRLIDKKG